MLLFLPLLNLQTSRFFNSFPNVNTLKIRLDHRNAIDLLDNLDGDFCKQIDELWLNAKNVGADPELRHQSDMANIFAKFENLSAKSGNPTGSRIRVMRIVEVLIAHE